MALVWGNIILLWIILFIKGSKLIVKLVKLQNLKEQGQQACDRGYSPILLSAIITEVRDFGPWPT
jgi:hypothetical protein